MIWRVPVLNIISKWVPAVERTQSMEGRLGQSRVGKQWDEAASQSVSCTNMFPLRQKYTGCQSNPNRNVSGRACGHFWGCHHALTFVSGRKPNLLFSQWFMGLSPFLLAPTGALIVIVCYYRSTATQFLNFYSAHWELMLILSMIL